MSVQSPLTVIAPIAPGKAQALESLLVRIGRDIKGDHENESERNVFVRFLDMKTLHFCRFVLIPRQRPTTEPEWTHLMFESNYDGDLDDHLDEWVDCSYNGYGIREIWSHCAGFPDDGGNVDRLKRDFKRYIRRYSYITDTFYRAYMHDTKPEVQRYQHVRDHLQDLFNLSEVGKFNWERRFDDLLQHLPARQEPKPFRITPGVIIGLIPAIPDAIAQWLRITVWRTIRRQILRRERRMHITVDRTADPIVDELHDFEDVITQNALTVLSPIAPGFFNRLRLRFALWVLHVGSRHIFNRGSLGGISTIHFARWVIVDGGEFLLFNSNYDGSWENYIGDFIDLASAGLDFVWQCTPDYAYASKDADGFKRNIRQYQLKVQVFYSARPDQTVFNVLNNRAITQSLEDAQFADLLGRL